MSYDTVADQAQFKVKDNLPFTLIADEDHKVADAYGVWAAREYQGKTVYGIGRTTFLINPSGTIVKVFSPVDPQTHSQSVLDALAELQ